MKIWTIILAAGAASRFGSPKALAPWKDGTLLSNAIAAAPQSENIVVVTGVHSTIIHDLKDISSVHNHDWVSGMGSSISKGIEFVTHRHCDIALIIPVDQPFITQDHLQKMAFQSYTENRCILTKDGELSGPPAAVPKHLFECLSKLKKSGLKSVITDFGYCEGLGMLRDIDTPDELKLFTSTN